MTFIARLELERPITKQVISTIENIEAEELTHGIIVYFGDSKILIPYSNINALVYGKQEKRQKR